jgi:hypothetical protein
MVEKRMKLLEWSSQSARNWREIYLKVGRKRDSCANGPRPPIISSLSDSGLLPSR